MDVPGSVAAGRRLVRGRRLQAGTSRGGGLHLNGARNVSVGTAPPMFGRGSTAGTSWRPAVAGVAMLAAAGLAAAGCSSSNTSSSVASCASKAVTAGTPGSAATSGGAANPAAAAGWRLPGGNLANTRDVASAITTANVSTLGVAWCVPVESTGAAATAGVTDGYSTTPVVVNGVVYLQDMESNVMAIKLATGKVLWTHNYSSPNGGPDGVTVAGGTVYAATTPLSSGANAPVAVDGDYIIAGAGVQIPEKNKQLIIAYRLGATGKLPDTVAP